MYKLMSMVMKAVGLYRYLPIDDPQSLVDDEVPTPLARGRDLLVRVRAVSVNPVDVKRRAPKSGQEESLRILGWDAAGVVEAVGEQVTLFRPGDEVYYAGSIDRTGSNAEYQLVDERIVGPKPRTLSFEEAAALPLTTITAWEGLFDRLGIAKDAQQNAGRSILIIGGAGGVGSIATQLVKQIAGLRVITTASRPETIEWSRSMGADEVIDHHEPLGPQLKALGISTVESILCTNSTERYIEQMAEIIAAQGKICTIVETKGNQPIQMNLFQSKSATFVWELMFTRPLYQTADMQAQHDLLVDAAQLLDAGTLRSTLTERFGPLNAANLRRAHARVESGAMIGKLVLSGIEQ